MSTDLTQFDYLPPDEIISLLEAQGYRQTGTGARSKTFTRPGEDHAILLSESVAQGEALASLCARYPKNPYLPRIYASRRAEGHPPAFLCIMEKLLSLDDLPSASRKTLGGGARALGLLIDGHHTHDDAHRRMMKKPAMREAVKGLVDEMQRQLDKGQERAVCCDSGYEDHPALPLDHWHSDMIRFRQIGPSQYAFVFADPFRECPSGTPAQHAALQAQIKSIKQRLCELSPKKEGPAQPQGPRCSL